MDRFVRRFFGRSDVGGTSCSCVRSDKRRAHNLLKLHCIVGSSKVKDTTDVGVFCSRYETGSLGKTRSNYQVFIGLFLILMAWSLAPYIHVILADVVSIT